MARIGVPRCLRDVVMRLLWCVLRPSECGWWVGGWMLGIEGRREGKGEKGRGRRMKDSDRSWEWWRLSLWTLTKFQLNSSEWYVA